MLWTAGSVVATSLSWILVLGAVAAMFGARWMTAEQTPPELDAAIRQYHLAAVVACGVPVIGMPLTGVLRRWISVTVHAVLLVLALAAVVVFHISATTHTDPARSVPSPSPSNDYPCYSGSGRCN